MPGTHVSRPWPRPPWPGWLLRLDEVLAGAAAANAGTAVAEDEARRQRWELEADVVHMLPVQRRPAG